MADNALQALLSFSDNYRQSHLEKHGRLPTSEERRIWCRHVLKPNTVIAWSGKLTHEKRPLTLLMWNRVLSLPYMTI